METKNKKNKLLKVLLITISIFLILWIGANLLLNYNDAKFNEKMDLAIANPASQFCTVMGGTLEIKTNTEGGQDGVCNFAEGKACNEWDLFYGKCNIENTVVSAEYKNATNSVIVIYNHINDKAYLSSNISDFNQLELNIAVSGSGARYLSADERVEFWEHQGEGTLSIDGEQVFVGADVAIQ